MDDILKRMMAVEAEAENIVKAAETDGNSIRSEARKEANAYLAEAQKKLAQEIADYTAQRLEKAEADEKNALNEGDEKLQERLNAFEKEIASHQNEVMQALLFPDWNKAN